MEPIGHLVLPEQVTVQLVDSSGSPAKMADVLFQITAFARQKNDYHLQPFATDREGLATITREQLDAEVAANHDSGLMDYVHISKCSSAVEIRPLTDEETLRAIEARKVWSSLLAGERDRWESLGQLLNLYRNANNSRLSVLEPTMRVVWDGRGTEYSYLFIVVAR
jgi:hypothetical protein